MRERRPSFTEVRKPASVFPASEMAFSAVQERLKKPQGFDPNHWADGLSVLRIIQGKMGKPLEVIADSPVGKNIPSTYQLENGVIKFMPNWRYVSVENNGKSTLVFIDPKRSDTDKHADSYNNGMKQAESIKDKKQREERIRTVKIYNLSLRIEDALAELAPTAAAGDR